MHVANTRIEAMQYNFGPYVIQHPPADSVKNVGQRKLNPDVKTSMNIEQIGPNHFRFIDEPPDMSQQPVQKEALGLSMRDYVPETQLGQEIEMQGNPQ